MGCGASKSQAAALIAEKPSEGNQMNSTGPVDEPVSVTDTGGSIANEIKNVGESLIMMHPPRKPQRLEEDGLISVPRCSIERLTMTSAKPNSKSSIQDVPEEDEDAEKEETAVEEEENKEEEEKQAEEEETPIEEEKVEEAAEEEKTEEQTGEEQTNESDANPETEDNPDIES